MRRKAPKGSWLSFADTYAVATEVLGRPVPLPDRAQLWSAIPIGQALTLIASMLKDLDIAEQPAAAVELGWVNQVSSVALRDQLSDAIREEARLLPPQILLLAALEAIEHCPSGGPADNFSGLDQILEAILGIAEASSAPRVGGESWGGLDSGLASELVAQHYFGHTIDPIDQLAWVRENWTTPWKRPVVKENLITRAGGEPRDLFLEATGVEIDDFAAVGVHLWVQAQQHGFLRYPSEFFDRLGIDRAAVDRFLAETSTDLKALKAEVAMERARTGASRWAFHSLRRRPIVQLENGEWLVLRIGFVIQRALGDATYWDVRTHLRAGDMRTGTKREEAFRGCLGSALEAHVGQALLRMFPGTGRSQRVFDETTMQKAWAGKKGQVPSACDFAVDCGDVWLLFDVTDRRIPENLINATADAVALDAELKTVVTAKKARQFASTVRHLSTDVSKLVKGRTASPNMFVCVVVTPTGGLGWNPAVHARAQELLADMQILQGGKVLSLAIMSVRDVTELESALESGGSARDLMVGWRANGARFSFEQVLQLQRIPLQRSRWVQDTAMQFIDAVIERMQGHG